MKPHPRPWSWPPRSRDGCLRCVSPTGASRRPDPLRSHYSRSSGEQNKRNCRLQRDDQIAQHFELIGAREHQPSGSPCSHVTNAGFNRNRRGEVGADGEDAGPGVEVGGAGGPKGNIIFASVAKFVCKIRPVRLLRSFWPCRSNSSLVSPADPWADGVGHASAIAFVELRPPHFLMLAFLFGACVTSGVGQDEHSSSEVGGSDGSR